jgi:predicted nucleotidyltransferase
MSDTIRKILTELKDRLASIYGERLKALYLFGSYARDEADKESDLDVLIVLDRVDNYSREIDRTGEVISAVSLKHGITLSRVFASEQQWREDQSIFFLNLREEAIPA